MKNKKAKKKLNEAEREYSKVLRTYSDTMLAETIETLVREHKNLRMKKTMAIHEAQRRGFAGICQSKK